MRGLAAGRDLASGARVWAERTRYRLASLATSPRAGEERDALRLEFHDLLLLLAEPVDAEADDVAGFQEFRLWLDAHADAGRRAGDDHIAGLQYEELRGVPDQMGHAEDHGLGRALLPRLVVDCEPHVEPLRVADLILGDEPRPERTE